MNLARARELAVLSLLAAHPAHGYEIAKAVSTGPLALLGLSRPAVYAILDRFRGRGWVEDHPEAGDSYPDRSVLSLTEMGRSAYAKRLGALGADRFAPTVPLIAVAMCLDSGAKATPGALDRLIEERRRDLDAWPSDPAHAASATARLARRMAEAELDVLEELRDEAGG